MNFLSEKWTGENDYCKNWLNLLFVLDYPSLNLHCLLVQNLIFRVTKLKQMKLWFTYPDKGRTSLCRKRYLLKTLQILICVFDWLHYIQCLTSFSSFDHLLHLYAQFLMLFHLTRMRFSRSTHLPIFLYLETSTSIMSTGEPILGKLIDLVNSNNFRWPYSDV